MRDKNISERKDDPFLEKLHKDCSHHKDRLQKVKKAGCFYCSRIFNTSLIKEWVGREGDEALCPYCGIDSVLPHEGQFPLTKEFLTKMYKYYFTYYIPLTELKYRLAKKKKK